MTTMADLYMARLRALLPDCDEQDRHIIVQDIRAMRGSSEWRDLRDHDLVRLVGAWVR